MPVTQLAATKGAGEAVADDAHGGAGWMTGTPCGPGVLHCDPPGRHRGGCRRTPLTRLAVTGDADGAVVTTCMTEQEG